MKVMLCGAEDLTPIEGFFQELINEMGFTALHYKQFMNYDNYNDWNENSKESVENVDIVIFVIIEQYGSITWNTEFETALSLGKPFIIFCLKDVYSFYMRVLKKNDISVTDDNGKKIYDLFLRFNNEKKTVIPFDINTFKKTLQKHLILILDRSIKLLNEENRKKTIIKLLEKNSTKEIRTLLSDDTKIKLLKNILFDPWQNKEIRKRVLCCFSNKGILNKSEIIQLINDPEQGMRRMIIAQIDSFANVEEDQTEIFDAIIEVCDNYDDIGLTNRAINSLWNTNPQLSITYLYKIVLNNNRESIRLRIIYLLNDNINTLYQYCKHEDFKDQLMSLINAIKKIQENKKNFNEIISTLFETLHTTVQ